MKLASVAAKRTFLVLTILTAVAALGQISAPKPRITQNVDESRLTTLKGNVHPLAQAKFDRGRAPDNTPANRMLLLLSRSEEQEKALRQFLDEQQTPGSANYHKWLTPEEFGQLFGPADADVQTVTTWLLNSGFQVSHISAARNVIEFSGTAGQLRQTFHTDLHQYIVDNKSHWANATDPQIPQALAPVVKGIVSLNNFPRKPMSRKAGVFARDIHTGETTPLLTVTGGNGQKYYPLGPGDFATIYNSNPLKQAGIDGAGQTIAIVGESNINLQDVTDFRNMFGLPNTPDNHTKVILNGPDPGIVSAEDEAILDVEWAGAAAPGASVILVVSESTETTFGVDLSALYIVENNLAPVMSESYGACEQFLGNAGNHFFNDLWEQASAQGITVVVSAGDNGSAGCDDQSSAHYATHGTAISGIASTPFNVALGGTDFNDKGSQTTYFNSTNGTGYVSAKSYVPEMTWNDSCAGGTAPTLNSCSTSTNLQLWSGSGGPSSCSQLSSSGACQSGTAKPSWQSGAGVPLDGVRDIPDVSFFAATGSSGSNSFYVVCQADAVPGYASCQPSGGSVAFIGAAGTSASAPAFAGVVALANQKIGSRLGNVNYLLYSIAAQSGASCSTSSASTTCIFRDVTTGSNSVPCQGGTPNCSATLSSAKGVIVDKSGNLAYLTKSGYDLATGLGSPNIANLINAMANAKAGYTPTSTTLSLNGGTALVTAKHGDSISAGVNVSPTASTGDVSLIGNNQGLDKARLSSGAVTWNSTLFPGGNYAVNAHYAGDGKYAASDSNGVQVSISPEASNTFVNLVTFDLTGRLQSFTGTSTSYGAPYVLRMDVTDAAGTISSTQGVSSKCVAGTASCPTGNLALTGNGIPLDGGTFALNNAGHSEDVHVQLAPGTYNLLATYSGDPSYTGSSGSTTISVGKAATTLSAGTAQLPPYEFGSLIDLSAGVSTTSNGEAPKGTITFSDNGTQITTTPLIYEGFPYSNNGSSPFYAWLGGSGSYPFNSLGTHSVTAQYSGDTNYAAAGPSTPFIITVTQGTTWFNNYGAVPNTTTPSLPVTLSADIFTNSAIDQPTGTVTFYDSGTALSGNITYGGHPGSWNSTGGGNYIAVLTARLPYTFTQLGTHTITATYSGDAHYKPSTMPTTSLNVVSALPTLVNWIGNYGSSVVNQPARLVAMISPTNYYPNGPALTGTVTFSENGTPLPGTVTYSSTGTYLQASLDYTFTTVGTHSITAQYSGDSNYAATTSQPSSIQIVGPFSLNLPSGTATIGAAGGSGSSTVSIWSNGGFTGQVSLTCSSVPATATCSLNPTSVNVPAYTSATAALSFTVPALSAELPPRNQRLIWQYGGGIVLGGVFVLGIPGVRRRSRYLLAVMLLSIGLGLIACGGGTSGGGTPPPPPPPRSQTYVLTIKGSSTDGSTATTTLTVTEQ